MQKDKLYELDVLRSIAFFAIVMQHVLGYYLRREGIATVDNIIIGILFSLVKFAVPLFVFISGLVYFYNYYNHLNYSRMIKNRIVDLIIPYVGWSFLYMLRTSKDFNVFNVIWAKQFIKNLLLGTARYHLWYVSMIVQGIIILPLVFYCFKLFQKKATTKIRFISIVIIFSLTYLAFISFYYLLFTNFSYTGLNNFFNKMFTRNFLSYIFYFIFGGLCGLYINQWKQFLKKYIIPITLLTILMYGFVEYISFSKGFSNGVMSLDYFGSLNIRFFFFSTLSIMMLYSIALLITQYKKKWYSIFNRINKYSYHAYLAHAFVLSTTYLYMYLHLNIKNYFLFYTILLGLTFVLSLVIGCIIQIIYGYCISVIKRIIEKKEGEYY